MRGSADERARPVLLGGVVLIGSAVAALALAVLFLINAGRVSVTFRAWSSMGLVALSASLPAVVAYVGLLGVLGSMVSGAEVARRRMWQRARRHMLLAVGGMAAVVGALVVVRGEEEGFWSVAVLGPAVFWLVYGVWLLPRQLRRLGGRGRSAGEMLCPRCSYNLRAQTVPRCPECGTVYTLGELI
jgi:hypothetical protein